MNLFTRAFYSIKNQFFKTMILFSITFILGNIMCGAISIAEAAIDTKKDFESTYGTKISIDYDSSYETAMLNNQGSDVFMQKYSNLILKMSHLNIYNYLDYTYVFKGLQSEKLSWKDMEGVLDLHLWGTSQIQPSDFRNYYVELKEGRYFTEEELNNGKAVVLVNKDFKTSNQEEIKVNDTITMNRNVYDIAGNLLKSEPCNYQVIGIYEKTDTIGYFDTAYTFDNISTRFYVPNSNIIEQEKQFEAISSQNERALHYNKFIGPSFFQLKSKRYDDYFSSFYFEEIKKIDEFFTPKHMMRKSSEIYAKISKPIESLTTISEFLIVMTAILTIFILNFVIFLLLRNRRHEIGILISLGEKKLKIIFQLVLEICIAGVVALGISLYTGNYLGARYSEYLLSNSIKSKQDELTYDEINQQQELLDNYHVSLNKQYKQQVLTIGTGVMILSSIVPVVMVTLMKPKKILL